MNLSKHNKLPKELIFISALFLSLEFLFTKPDIFKKSDYLAPPKIIKHLSAGLKTQFSDSFWLRAVQDFDYCDQLINERDCKGKSWLFDIIDLSSDLDLNFFEVFYYGGLALTVIISDYKGASEIFDKGIQQFPNNWELNYLAAYHAMAEEKNYAKAGRLYYAAANNGAPSWVRLLAGRMAMDGGDKQLAKQALSELIKLNEQPIWIERLQKKIENLNE